jgi:hypothetical protein
MGAPPLRIFLRPGYGRCAAGWWTRSPSIVGTRFVIVIPEDSSSMIASARKLPTIRWQPPTRVIEKVTQASAR